MAHGFILEKSIRAKDVDSLNKNVISIAVDSDTIIGDDIDGGYVFQLTKTKLSDLPANVGLTGSENGELYRVSKPLTEDNDSLDETTILAHANGLAMAYNPSVKNLSFEGKEYAGLSPVSGRPSDWRVAAAAPLLRQWLLWRICTALSLLGS